MNACRVAYLFLLVACCVIVPTLGAATTNNRCGVHCEDDIDCAMDTRSDCPACDRAKGYCTQRLSCGSRCDRDLDCPHECNFCNTGLPTPTCMKVPEKCDDGCETDADCVALNNTCSYCARGTCSPPVVSSCGAWCTSNADCTSNATSPCVQCVSNQCALPQRNKACGDDCNAGFECVPSCNNCAIPGQGHAVCSPPPPPGSCGAPCSTGADCTDCTIFCVYGTCWNIHAWMKDHDMSVNPYFGTARR